MPASSSSGAGWSVWGVPASSRHSRTRPSPDHSGIPAGAYHATTWCFARVIATYSRRSSSPRSSSSAAATWSACSGWVVPPTSTSRSPASSWNTGTSEAPPEDDHRYGQYTTGNSSPLDPWIVRICTASRSVSSRRSRSSSPSPWASATWSRNQVASPVGPRCSPVAAAWASSARCSRSASTRSPPSSPSSRRRTSRCSRIDRKVAATPWVVSVRAHRCTSSCSRSQSCSVAAASRSAVQPIQWLSARARTRDDAAGRSSASSSRRQSVAAGVRNTLPAPPTTAGTSTARSASWTSSAWACERTSTATSPASRARRRVSTPSASRSASSGTSSSSATTSAARSRATRSRTWAAFGLSSQMRNDGWRGTTRSRSGVACRSRR